MMTIKKNSKCSQVTALVNKNLDGNFKTVNQTLSCNALTLNVPTRVVMS